MNKIWTIVQREYITRVRRRIFLITTLLLPVGIALIFVMPIIVANYSSETLKIAVVDESGIFKDKFVDHKDLYYKAVDSPYAQVKKNYQNDYTGILYIPSNFDVYHPSGIQLYSNKQIGLTMQETIGDDLTKIARDMKLQKLQVKQESLDDADKAISFDSIIAGEYGEKKGNTAIATILGYIMGFFIYIVMFVYGAMVLRGVMEEKTNRISEVIISSVKPFELMMGKIVGVGLVGLTQFFLWIVLALGTRLALSIIFHDQLAAIQSSHAAQTSNQNLQLMNQMMDALNNLPLFEIIGCFLFYFLGGYLLYSALFAAVGSAAGDDPGDTQSLNLIVTLPIILSIIIMTSVLQQPNSRFAVITSLIPFCTPVVMSARIPFGVPTWQIIVSMINLIIGFLFTTWIAGKIYRTGILMYGKKVTLKELGKWLFYKN